VAINHVYAPDQQFAAQAISQAGAAEYQQGQNDRLRAIEQFNAQLEQRDREFYDNLAYQQDAQALNYATNQDRMALDAYQGDQRIEAGLADSRMRSQYGLADTALRGNLQAAMQGQQTAGMMARDMQETRLKQAMSEHDAIQKAWLDGEHFTSDDQFKQAKSAWENKWGALGLTWGLPDQIAQQQAQQNDAMKVGQIETSFFTNPIDGAPLIAEGAVQSMLELGMEPKEIATIGVKMQAEARQRAALMQKEGEADRKLQEEDQKAQQKEQIEAAKEAAKEATKTMRDSIAGEREWRQSQEEYSRDVAQYEADMKAYEAAKSAHSKAASATSRSTTGAAPKPFTQTPPMKPVPPTPGLFADKIPTPQSPEEVNSYLPGTRFLAPDGSIRVR
jgi:hypothetical protein